MSGGGSNPGFLFGAHSDVVVKCSIAGGSGANAKEEANTH